MLRVQRYVNDISNIIEKTERYCRELGILGKYRTINIRNNIKNYLDMVSGRNELIKEELIIIIKEFSTYVDETLVKEYCNDKKYP